MCDFSAYGGPSPEWLAVQAELPAVSAPARDQISQFKSTVNQTRESASAQAMRGYERQLIMKDHKVPTRDGQSLEVRSYHPRLPTDRALPVYVHLHGGGFIFGTLSSEDATCARLAVKTGVLVVNVNYRHTPEFAYPVAWNDVEDAITWLHANVEALGGDGQNVVIGGISAGAQLAASVVLRKHLGMIGDTWPAFIGQVLMIPCLVHKDCYGPQLKQMKSESISSHVENENAPIIPKDIVRFFLDLLAVESPDETDLRLNPGNASLEQVKGLPYTTLGIAGLDPLRDEGLLYGRLLSEAGVATDIHLFKGVPHGFRRFGDKLSASKRWDEVMQDGILYALQPPKPTGQFDIKAE